MYEFSETALMVGAAVRQFAEREIKPRLAAQESGAELPYPLMREMARALGFDNGFEAMMGGRRRSDGAPRDPEAAFEQAAMTAMLVKELSRVSPSFCLAFGATVGLCGQTIARSGTPEQIELYAKPVLRLEKIGAWGMTEPGSGSDAFGLKTLARRDGDYYVLDGSKTFITNAPFAEIMVIYAKLDKPGHDRVLNSFIVLATDPGVRRGPPLKKLGMHGSPTGEIFLDGVRLGPDRLLGGTEKEPKKAEAMDVFAGERGSLPAMALGIIEKCLEVAVAYCQERHQFGRPIGEYQAMQLKLADMYVSYQNVRNMLLRNLWATAHGKADFADLCAMKLYSAREATRVALEAVQILGGNGYMQEYHVEMLMRDAKLLEIGGGTNEIQALAVAKNLLRQTPWRGM